MCGTVALFAHYSQVTLKLMEWW